ncbi:hypothetical protein GIY30_24035 [Gordonia sp. HNM0687]|uniref:Uncharacterized protein n=1 Tax=Gordonia mangrovi TaxID=2665643 RepID=A0A6L7GZN4_9ACTN|nr:hypothetical protein [Gordonia mangrovi]MDY6808956.1 hypothetical protein [Actinomycetota bacterium]MXP24395.1 hypothetical protein [Gordonia mangrovi]UVF79969.1 hypothetical protein NWF22_09175 [Gordonia mangrovi]
MQDRWAGVRRELTPLRAGIGLVVTVILVVVIWQGYLTMQGRQTSEGVATAACTDALRSEIEATFDAVGGDAATGEGAQFSDVATRPVGLTDDDRAIVTGAGHSVDTIEVAWAMTGSVTIPGYRSSGAAYGPTNTFACTAAVLDDDTAVVVRRTIN